MISLEAFDLVQEMPKFQEKKFLAWKLSTKNYLSIFIAKQDHRASLHVLVTTNLYIISHRSSV